jgi:hypothetical protein
MHGVSVGKDMGVNTWAAFLTTVLTVQTWRRYRKRYHPMGRKIPDI